MILGSVLAANKTFAVQVHTRHPCGAAISGSYASPGVGPHEQCPKDVPRHGRRALRGVQIEIRG